MKRYIAAALSAVIMLSASGCSRLEQEHFEKSLNLDRTGIAVINADLTYTVDPEALFDGVVDMAAKTEDGENDTEFDKEDFDSSDFINEMRFLFDENRKCEITLSMEGLADFDKNYSDVTVYAGLNGITLNCGKAYTRGNTVYYDKRFAYTMGAFTTLIESSDFDELNERYAALDELFGDKKYLRASFANADGTGLGADFAKELGKKYYNSAKDLLKGFDSGCVSRIENGTRFELTAKDFTAVSKRFAAYLKKNKTETADFLNEYLADSFAMNAAIAGDEAAYLADMAEMFKITPANITELSDGYNELLGEPGYKAFMESFDISLVNDITEKDGVQSSETAYTVAAGGKNAVEMKAVQTEEKAAKADFAEIDTAACADYFDFMKILSERDIYDEIYPPFDPEMYEDYEQDETAEEDENSDGAESDFFDESADITSFKA
ncbi:MAG: hypothetical protein IJR59_00230 [Firmicutes bacterium]|nr:hypothetical protein [Bacillota bacterium]